MENDTAANHRERPEEAHLMVKSGVLACAVSLSKDVAEVADVPSEGGRPSMGVTMRVVVGSCSCAALEEVAILVDVETVLVAWVQSCKGALDAAERLISSLAEVDNALSSLVRLAL